MCKVCVKLACHIARLVTGYEGRHSGHWIGHAAICWHIYLQAAQECQFETAHKGLKTPRHGPDDKLPSNKNAPKPASRLHLHGPMLAVWCSAGTSTDGFSRPCHGAEQKKAAQCWVPRHPAWKHSVPLLLQPQKTRLRCGSV